jgi:hypothetical protein
MADDEQLSPFARACEGQELTEAEVAQLWAEAPVTHVTPEETAWLEAELEKPVVPPGLQRLVDRARLEGWGG